MSNEDKRADEIVEEIMKSIYDDLDNMEKEKKISEECVEEPEEYEEEPEGYVEEPEEYEEEPEETEEKPETEAERAYRKHMFRKKLSIIFGSIFGVLIVIYVGIALYFGSHFMFYTKINGTDFSMKNVRQVEAYMEQQVADYVLTLKESDGDVEKIDGQDISLTYIPGEELKKYVEEQNNFLWITSLWDHPEIEASVGVKYDKTKFSEEIAALQCLKKENQTVSVNAHPEFKETQFEVVPEVVGTQIDTEKFNEQIKKALDGFQPELDLLKSGCYILPKFVSDSEEVIKAAENMNSYLGAEITYDFNPNTELVDSAVIAKWITVNDNMEVTFNEKAVKEYIEGLAEKYNTRGKPRKFTTANGNTVTVEGGVYGWKIDQKEEYKLLTANIEKGEKVKREPAYAHRAASHGAMDVGDTYAEVDLSNQKAYFIKDGQVVLSSDVVTGNPNRGNATPQGTYTLTYKTRNAVLRGDRKPDGTYSYETPVAYWMPFNGGIGFHDATWQSSFGGSRYKSHGSHGCINMPKQKAKEMYDLISDGTPVICHY